MTRDDFAKVLATLSVLPGGEVDKVRLAVYWEVLKDLTLEELSRAAAVILRTKKFFPVPAEILELARPRNLGAEAGRVYEQITELADYSDRVGSTWSETKIRLWGGDRVADAYMAAGGSAAFRSGDPVWTRKAFVESYVAHPPEECPPPLPASAKARRELGRGPTTNDPKVLQLVRGIGNAPRLKAPDPERTKVIDDAAERAQK